MPYTSLLRAKCFFTTVLVLFITHIAWGQAPPKPVLQWPLDKAQGYTEFYLDLRWTSAPGSHVYDVYIGPDPANLHVFAENAYPDFANDSCVIYVVADTFHLLAFYPPADESTIYWKIVAKDNGAVTASDVWSFTMGRQNLYPPDAPTQPIPANNSINISRSPILQWTASTDPEGDTPIYDLYLSTSASPAAGDLIATGLTGTSFQVTTPTRGNTTYYWKVVAKDPGGLETAGNVWKFTTLNTPPPVVTQSFPAHQAADVDYNLTFTWEKAIDEDEDSVHYEFWYGTGAMPDRMQTVNGLSLVLQLAANTTYSWKVVAVDSRGGSSESGIHTFTTKNNAGNAAPAVPQLQNPLNNSTGINFQQTLQWSGVTDADNDIVKYAVYIGTTQQNLVAVSKDLTVTSFLPALLSGKTYYWKVAAYDGKGGVAESNLWQFTTTTDDPGLTNFRFYYRYADPTQIYKYEPAILSPAFELTTASYTTRGKTTMKDAVALVLDYTDPSTAVTFDLPAALTVTEGITYNYGLPFGATRYYMFTGTFAAHNVITVHLQSGAAKRSYTIDARINEKPTKPLAVEPAGNATNVSTAPTLKWTDGDDPDGGTMTYRVFLGVSSSQLAPRGFVTGKSFPVPALVGSQRYYWKVIAYDAEGESTESDIYSFVTEKVTVPIVPALEYPREISVYVEKDVTLTWRYIDDPGITYDVYFDTKPIPDRVAQGVAGTTYAVSNLLPNTAYYWKVVAIDQQGRVISSTTRKFITKPLNGNETGTFTDPRDGQIYQWVRLGGEKWMVHNLSYQPDPQDGYYGYETWNEISRDKNYVALTNNSQNISKYGYLYTWTGAMNFDALPDTARYIQGVCPCGWHIPSVEDWNKLYPLTNNKPAMMHYSTWRYAGKENEWLNSSGLSLLSSGFFNAFSGQFEINAQQMWIAQRDRKTTNQRGISYSESQNFFFDTNNNTYGASSVRCVKNTADNLPPAAPQLQSPLNNSQNIPFNGQLKWYTAADPDNGDIVVYDLYLDTAAVPAKLIQQNITGTTYTLSELEPGKKYYWRVRARDTSGEIAESMVWSFTSESNNTNTAPPAPQLTAPAHQSTAVGITPAVFQWAPVTDADGDAVKYHFYISRELEGLQLTARDLTTTSYQVSGLTAGIKYYWKVVATDAHGGRAESTVAEFTTLNRAPAVPVLLTPVNGVEGVPLQNDLTWAPVTDPDGDKVYYKLMFGTSPTVLGEWGTDRNATRYTIPWNYLQLNTVYYWKVIAIDEKGGEAESEVRSFKTNGGPAAGAAPTLVSPVNWSTNISVNPLLKWTNPGSNFKYDLYVGVESMSQSLIAGNLTDTSFTVTQLYGANKLKPHSIYFWKVIAKVSGSTLVRESPTWRFTTLNNAPSKPVLTNPSANAPILKWTAAADPDNDLLVYDVYLGTDADPATVVAADLQLRQYNVAALAPGTYYWKVVVKDAYGGSTSSDISSFTIQPPVTNNPPSAPVLQTPVNGSDINTATETLTWSASTDAEGGTIEYDVYFGTAASGLQKAGTVTATSFNTAILKADTTYYWKVVARDPQQATAESDTWSFTYKVPVVNQPPSAPVLQTPANNSDINTATTTLTWLASTDAEGGAIEYDVYFGSTLQKVATVSTNTFTTSTLTANTTYYWKVVARDPQQATAESAAWSFTYKVPVVNQPPSAPVLQTPANNSDINTAITTLTWLASTDAEGGAVAYDVYFGTTLQKVATVSTNTFTTPTLTANTTYYWKVVAKDPQQATAESATWSFTYKVNQPPAAPQLISPADQSKIAATTPVIFDWSQAADPEHGVVTYDLYVSTNPQADVKVIGDYPGNSYMHMNLAPNTYYWKVVAKDDHNNTTTSAIYRFNTVNAFTISGKVTFATGRGLPNILLSALVKTDDNGIYSVSVPPGWSGTFKPVFWNYEFDPKEIVYTNVQADHSAQDYTVKVITAINDPELDSLVQVQPNPTTGPVDIILPVSLHTWQLEVHDIKGMLVHAQKIAGNAGKLQIRIPGKGVYLLRLSNQQKTVVRKIIVL